MQKHQFWKLFPIRMTRTLPLSPKGQTPRRPRLPVSLAEPRAAFSSLTAIPRYMDELTGGKGVIFATGTPVSNSMTELYIVN